MLSWGELTSGSGQNPCSPSEEILKGERVQHVCSREGVTVFVLENGKVYIRARGWKRNSKPGQFTHFKEQKIDIAESGISHILFLSKTGIVFQSEVKSKETAAKVKDFSIMKPQVLKSLSNTHIIQVACGNNHSLALSKNGQLFAWGQNTYGQLGHGTKDVSQHSPQSVISLTGMPVAQIAAGGDHSFTLSLSGTVFGWGRNNHGQLGLKDTEDRLEPNHVTLLKGKRTIYIACGEEHTAVLTKVGLVYTFGAGSYGQLGHNSTKDEIKPHLIGYLFGSKVSQIACGSYHTLVFVPSCGKIYSFGRGEEGQLGNKETRDQLVPLSINITDIFAYNGYEDGHGAKLAVKRIFAGGHQSFAECCDEMDLLPCVNQSFNILRRTVTVDHLLEQELDKNTRKGIVRAFSSSQTLCGSFLDVNKDGHFKTNGETSGLNLSAVYLGFVMLAKNSSVLQQVKNAVQNNLIPSLPRSPTCVETLRVYIIIPELIAVLGESRDSATLLESLSRSILSLEDSYFKILERWWCTMPYYFFLRLVRMYQKESHRLLQLTMTGASQCNPQLHNSLKILQTLYQVNLCRHHTIQERNFCIPVMKVIKDSLTAFAAQCFPKAPPAVMDPFINDAMRGCYMPFKPEYEQFKQYLSVLCKIKEELIPYRCIFDMETKLKLWKMESQMLQKQAFISEPILSLEVSRDAVLRDVLDNLRSQGTGDQYVAFQEPEMDDVFYLLGILCRFVVSNGFICNFHFPLALYKKLLHVPPTLDDLKELSPTEGKSLQGCP
ncbi:probable E3 ubiquitin-protein ligase HERC3 isoform X3 [Chiloscyllium plagiosum]|uniref:probable E3 ubiquitin-protein ligase HERC3 isoform X3 n=1 Tax=Chiloscyllium plagiosum TaxID=36176 RepID=UPI001CB7CD65|nr:probable E3 ubiquitin-protein ligase HERC3 isoform X3 [Chiloscyllium plagiosum]